jgi:hypothetical protein
MQMHTALFLHRYLNLVVAHAHWPVTWILTALLWWHFDLILKDMFLFHPLKGGRPMVNVTLGGMYA